MWAAFWRGFLKSLSELQKKIIAYNFFCSAIRVPRIIQTAPEMKTSDDSWSNAFDPKGKFEVKVSKRCYYFLEPLQKSGPKVAHFYCMKAYRE